MLTWRSGEYWEGSNSPAGVCVIEDISQRLSWELSPLPTACEHFPSAHSGPSSDTLTLIKATPRISIQITSSSESGFRQMTYHPCFDLHHKLLEKRHSSHSLNLPDFQSTRITWTNMCQETGWKSPSGEHPSRRRCGGSLGLLHTLPYDGITCQCKEVPTQPLPFNECQK